jgi:hypothetical protein
MSRLEYSQEYLGEFVDELRQFFPTELIQSCLTLNRNTTIPKGQNFCGVDVARMGRDDSVMFSLTLKDDNLYELDVKITNKTYTTDTVNDILHLDRIHNYKNIYIDDGGMGVGVFDPLLLNDQTKRKVIPINNSSRGLTHSTADKDRRKKLLKEDLYNNLRSLMEQGRIKLRDSPDVALSLKSIQVEYTNTKMRIFGNYSHITEALIRAAWCIRSKSLNIYIY